MKLILIPAMTALALSFLAASPAFAHDPTTGTTEPPNLPSPAPSEPAAADHSFDHFIQAIDVVLTGEQMLAQWPDAKERLVALAMNRQRSSFERWRATSLLGHFVTPEVEDALISLSSDANERVRAMAYYVLGVAFLNDGDEALFAHLRIGLEDESERVRADIVRSLGWTDHKQAENLLQEIARGEDKSLHRIAERSLARLR